nr:reverse transcriptase domain-containing protein [Tanacetum cinerariifolium]
MAEISKNLMNVLQINQQVKAVTPSCETYGVPHAYNDCPATVGHTQNVYTARAYNQGGNSYQPRGNHNLVSYHSDNYLGPLSTTITNRKEDLKCITTRSGIAFKGPTTLITSSPPKVVERETRVTKDTVPPTNNESTKDVQPLVVQIETQVLNSEPVVEPVEAFVSALKPNTKPSIPYPTRVDPNLLNDFEEINMASNGIGDNQPPSEGALKAEMAKNSKNLMKVLHINQQVKAVTPSCETYSGPHAYNDCPATVGHTQNVYAARAYNQGGNSYQPRGNHNLLSYHSDNYLRPLSMTITTRKEDLKCITTRSGIAYKGPTTLTTSSPPKVVERETRVTKDTTGRASIVVFEGELTLSVGNKAVTFNLDQTLRYSSNCDDILVNRIEVIDVACEEYSQEVLGFFVSGNPTPSTKPIVSTSSPTLTPFGDYDFLLEENDAFLAIKDEPISLEIDDSYYDSERDILLLEEFLNDDPSSPPLLL